MVAKTAVLAYADLAVADVLQKVPAGDDDRAAAMMARTHLGQTVRRGRRGAVGVGREALYPPEGTICALEIHPPTPVATREVLPPATAPTVSEQLPRVGTPLPAWTPAAADVGPAGLPQRPAAAHDQVERPGWHVSRPDRGSPPGE